MKNNRILVLFLCLIFVLPAYSKVKRYEFGDYSSNTLIEKASACLNDSDWKGVELYTDKCIQLYRGQAIRMQNQLKDYPDDNASLTYWALNHVAYAHYIRAEMYSKTGKHKKAYKEYEIPVKKFKFSKCFDPSQNIFWKIADECQSRMSKMINTFGKDFFGVSDQGDNTSNNQTRKVEMKTKEMRKLPNLNTTN